MYRAVEDLRRWATNCSATLSAARLNQTRSWVDRGRSWLASVKRKALFEAERLYVLVIGLRLSRFWRRRWEFPELGTSEREDLKAKVRQLSIP